MWPTAKRTGDAVAKQLRLLLQEMLHSIYRVKDAPMQFRIDSVGITAAALKRSLTVAELDRLPCADEVTAAFDDMVNRAMADTAESAETGDCLLPGEDPGIPECCGCPEQREVRRRPLDPLISALASWLERLHEHIRSVDSSAIAIVALRIQHRTDREIAGKLDLGLRLVRRLVRDLREALEGAAQT